LKRAYGLVAAPFTASVQARRQFRREGTLGGSHAGYIGDIFMTITSAHIPAVVALVAGVLILIMPRLLNLVVAIYLICTGLIGLGLLRWLHL
jgi:hypothetical protein